MSRERLHLRRVMKSGSLSGTDRKLILWVVCKSSSLRFNDTDALDLAIALEISVK